MKCPNGCTDGTCPVELKFGSWKTPPTYSKSPSRSAYLSLAFERQPFVLADGCATEFGWPVADGRFGRLDYLRGHPHVVSRADDEDAALLRFKNWSQDASEHSSGHSALSVICDRNATRVKGLVSKSPSAGSAADGHEAPKAVGGSLSDAEREAHIKLKCDSSSSSADGDSLYLSAWEYDPPETECAESAEGDAGPRRIAEDFRGGCPFAQCLLEKSAYPCLRAFSMLLRWIYVGERGTACPTHVDPIGSHAWMWLASGTKQWRFLSVPTGVVHPSGMDAMAQFPDLFDCAAIAESAPLGATLGHCALKVGELLFVPSMVAHAVRNTELTIAVSHNFVDTSNLLEVLVALHSALQALNRLERQVAEEQGRELGVAGDRSPCSDKATTLSVAGQGEEQEQVADVGCASNSGEISSLRDTALEMIGERLDAPLFALLSVTLIAPWAVHAAIEEARSELYEHEADTASHLVAAWNKCCKELVELQVPGDYELAEPTLATKLTCATHDSASNPQPDRTRNRQDRQSTWNAKKGRVFEPTEV